MELKSILDAVDKKFMVGAYGKEVNMDDIFNTKDNHYELVIGEKIAYATYRKEGSTLYIDHVYSPPELRGTGAASRLMQYIKEAAVAEGLQIIPICSYAASWLQRYS